MGKQTTSYLFLFNDYDFPVERINFSSFKVAIISLYDYFCGGSDLFLKCLKGFDENDVDGLISIFEYFSHYEVSKIYSSDEFYFWQRKERED